MMMRGHVNRMEDPSDAHKPACAGGAYLNILKVFEVLDVTKNVLGDALQGVEITQCEALDMGGSSSSSSSGSSSGRQSPYGESSAESFSRNPYGEGPSGAPW